VTEAVLQKGQADVANTVKPINTPRRTSIRRIGNTAHRLTRIVAFAWCGAGASVYRKLAASLPNVDFVAVQLPGREDRYDEDRLVRMKDVVESLIGDIIPLLDRPVTFFGHSMGALVAYEVALAIRQRTGQEPTSLIVSGHGAPHCGRPGNYCWHAVDEGTFVDNLRTLGGTPGALLDDPSTLRAFLPTLRADYEVVETYKPRAAAPLSCPLLACAGGKDKEVSPETMHAWMRYTTGPCELHWFIGDHFYLCSQPRTLVRRLEESATAGTFLGGDVWESSARM
jgi:surfactin synthase thioesterase subunit